MKILFICGSLEPGRDGVGDYTRRLAGELIRQGHKASIIAYNDRQLEKVLEAEQESDGTKLQVLRLPSTLGSKEKLHCAKQFIIEYDPEWLSLQFVLFAFQKKGIPFRLGRQLKILGKGRQWHVMFHELWVGMNNESPLKLNLWGIVQKYCIKQILKNLSAKKINTQTGVYQWQIQQLRYQVEKLPLYSNIPIKTISGNNKNNQLNLVVFGTIHAGAPIDKFAKELKQYSKINNKKITVHFIGKCGTYLEHWLNAFTQNNIHIVVHGIQSEEKISELLSNSDWGISSTPYLLIEKSGTAAAMLEHGLSILVLSNNWTVSKYTAVYNNQYLLYNMGDLSKQLSNIHYKKKEEKLPFVTNQFIKNLSR